MIRAAIALVVLLALTGCAQKPDRLHLIVGCVTNGTC